MWFWLTVFILYPSSGNFINLSCMFNKLIHPPKHQQWVGGNDRICGCCLAAIGESAVSVHSTDICCDFSSSAFVLTTWRPHGCSALCCCSWRCAVCLFMRAASPILSWWWWMTSELETWAATAIQRWGKSVALFSLWVWIACSWISLLWVMARIRTEQPFTQSNLQSCWLLLPELNTWKRWIFVCILPAIFFPSVLSNIE